MTDRFESPDPHFQKKLASVKSKAELEGFKKQLWASRTPTLGEQHAIASRSAEIAVGR